MRIASLLLLLFPVIGAFGQSQDVTIQPPPGVYHQEVSLDPPAGSWQFRFEGNRIFRSWDRPLVLSTLSGDERRFVLEVQPTGNPEGRQRLSYTIDRRPPAPSRATPSPGVYSEGVEVRLESDEGRVLYQVLPTNREPIEYQNPVSLPGKPGAVTSYLIESVVVGDQGSSSRVETHRYVIDRSQEEEAYLKIVSPVPGRFSNAQLLYIVSRGLEEVRYSLDGSDPRTGGTRYAGPVLIAREGSVSLSVVGVTQGGEIIEKSLSYEGERGSLLSTPQGFYDGAVLVDLEGLRDFRYRLEDIPVTRTDAVLTRGLEIRPIPNTRRSVILRLNDSPEEGTPDFRYTFILDSRDVPPPRIHLFSPEADRISFALERETEVETEYAVFIDGRPYRSGVYSGPVEVTLPRGVTSGEGLLRARSRSGAGSWSDFSEEEFVFSTGSPSPVSVILSPEGPSPAKKISFEAGLDRVVRYELRSITDPERRVTERSGRLEDGDIISIPYSTRERSVLSYATFDSRGNASPERSVELVLDHDPPVEPEISIEGRQARIRGSEETYVRVVSDGVLELPGFRGYERPFELPLVPDRRVGYTIEAYTRDAVGNASAVVSKRVYVDDRPLTIPPLIGVEDGKHYSADAVRVSAAFPSPGLSLHYTLSLDGTVPPLPTETAATLEDPLEVFGTDGEVVSVHLRVRVRSEESGRFGEDKTIRFVIDREVPELPPLLGVENGGVYRGGREVTLGDSEPGSSLFLVLSDDEAGERSRRIPYDGPILLDVPEGTRTEFFLAVEIVDAAGNRSSSAFPTRVVIDRQVPGAPEPSLTYQDGVPLLRLEGGDGDLFYSLTPRPGIPEAPDQNSTLYTGPVSLDPGRYLLSAREIDAAGNAGPVTYSSEIHIPTPDEDLYASPVLLADWQGENGVLIWPEAHRRDLRYRFSFLAEDDMRLYTGPVEFRIPEDTAEVALEYLLFEGQERPRRLVVRRPGSPGLPEISPEEDYRTREDVEVTATGAGTLRYEISTTGPPASVSRRSPEWPGTVQLPGRDGETVVFDLALRSFTDAGAGEVVRRTFVVDRSPPGAPRLTNAQDGEFYDDSRRITLEHDDADVFYRVLRNPDTRAAEAQFEGYSEPILLEAVDGELSNYRIEAYSVDAVGNRSPQTAVWSVYLDREIIYVAPDGSDRGAGTRESPFQTLGRAVERIRESDRETIFLATGVYEISRPLRSDGALAIQGGLNPETWRSSVSGETVILPVEEFAGDALITSYGGSVTISRLTLSSTPSFEGSLLLVDNVVTSLDSVSLSSAGGRAIDARQGSLSIRRVVLNQTGSTSEGVVLRGTTATIESSVLRAGSVQSERAVALDMQSSASLTIDRSRIEAYGISRATAVSTANSSLEAVQSTFRVGASRGNAQAVSSRDGGVLIEASVLQADDETRVSNLLVSRDGTLAVIDSLLELSGQQGAVGIVASGGLVDVRGSRFVGTSLNDFTYGIQARGIEGVFVNNVFQAGQVGEYIAGSLVDSPSQWIHNTFLGYRASPFIQLLNIRGTGRTLFGNNLALQGAAGSGTGLVVSGRHDLEIRGNLFAGWGTILATDDRQVSSLSLLESGRVMGVLAGENGVVSLDESIGRDGVPYRLFPDSPAIDRAVELQGSEEVLFDIEGQRRPAPVPPDGSFRQTYEGRSDVGADEYYP